MEIQSSLQGIEVCNEYRRKLASIKYPQSRDLGRMLKNIETMNSDLSKLEVEARRNKNPSFLTPKLTEINAAVNQLNQWLMFAFIIQ